MENFKIFLIIDLCICPNLTFLPTSNLILVSISGEKLLPISIIGNNVLKNTRYKKVIEVPHIFTSMQQLGNKNNNNNNNYYHSKILLIRTSKVNVISTPPHPGLQFLTREGMGKIESTSEIHSTYAIPKQ